MVQRRITVFILFCPMTDLATESDVRPELEAGLHFRPTTHDGLHFQYSHLTAEGLTAEADVGPQPETGSDFRPVTHDGFHIEWSCAG